VNRDRLRVLLPFTASQVSLPIVKSLSYGPPPGVHTRSYLELVGIMRGLHERMLAQHVKGGPSPDSVKIKVVIGGSVLRKSLSQAAVLVHKYPNQWTFRRRGSGPATSLKWIRRVDEIVREAGPWQECMRTCDSAVFPPWPGNWPPK